MTPHRRSRATICATLVLVASLAGLGAARAQPARDCAVDRVDGPGARMWVHGTWQPLAPGPLPAGEPKIVTASGTRVAILCSDGTAVTVAPETEVNLESLLGAPGPRDSVVIQLIEGLVGLVAPERRRDRFEVRTPLAIASVRSTEWVVQHGGEGSAVFVRHGAVRVAWEGGSAGLGAGDGIDIPADGRTQGVKRWGQARIDRVAEALGLDWR